MDTEESFEVTFKSRPSSPHNMENNRDATPVSNHSSSPTMASDTTQSTNENQFDTLMSIMQNVNQQLLGMRQEYHELRGHVDNLHRKIENPMLDRGDNHHECPLPWSEPNHPNSHFYMGPNQYQTNPLYRQGEHSSSPYSFPEINRNDNRIPTTPITRPHVAIKPQTFDGSEDFNEYLAQFEILVDLHGWDYKTKSLYLASSLTGNARALLSELNENQRRDFNSLVKTLNRRYGSVERSEMFRARLKPKPRVRMNLYLNLPNLLRN